MAVIGRLYHLHAPAADIGFRRDGDFDILVIAVGILHRAALRSVDVDLVDPRPTGRDGVENRICREAVLARILVDTLIPLGRYPRSGLGKEVCLWRLRTLRVVDDFKLVLNRRGLFADRLDNGVLREPVARTVEAVRIGSLGEVG